MGSGALVEAVGEDIDAMLLKADGARNRLFEAPDDHEPRVPDRADTVRPVASAAGSRTSRGATAAPVVNTCDDGELAETGRAVAEGVLERAAVPRVVLARMDRGRVVEVVD